MMIDDWIVPEWPAAAAVRAVTTTRAGGISRGVYHSMNPAGHVGDDPLAVATNRQRLRAQLALPAEPVWLQQVHGTGVIAAAEAGPETQADGSWTDRAGVVCVVLTADCLPVLLCDRQGRCVAVVHAGWRGLAAGVIEAAVTVLQDFSQDLLAWLGPAIGPQAFEVGEEVRAAFVSHDPQADRAFVQGTGDGLHADIYTLARQRLQASGVSAIYGGGYCTSSDVQRFFSYRRDGTTGRMASLIWLAGE